MSETTGPMTLSRRELVRLAMTSAAALPWMGLIGCGPDPTEDPDEPDEPPITVEPDPQGVRPAELRKAFFADRDREAGHPASLGRRWVEAIGAKGDDEALGQELAPTLEILSRDDDLERALAELEAAIAADFDALDIYTLQGWTFARTELHLCALAASV